MSLKIFCYFVFFFCFILFTASSGRYYWRYCYIYIVYSLPWCAFFTGLTWSTAWMMILTSLCAGLANQSVRRAGYRNYIRVGLESLSKITSLLSLPFVSNPGAYPLNQNGEVKPKPLDDDTEEFLPSQPTEYKMCSREFKFLINTVRLVVVVQTRWLNLANITQRNPCFKTYSCFISLRNRHQV